MLSPIRRLAVTLAFGWAAVSLVTHTASAHETAAAGSRAEDRSAADQSAADEGAADEGAADAQFVAAQRAFRRNDLARFERASAAVGAHPLSVYLEYWDLSLRIDETRADLPRAATDIAIARHLAEHRGALHADLLRRDWLLDLGRRGDWERFDAEYRQWILRDDERVECYRLLGRLDHGERVAQAARTLLMRASALNDECHQLFDALLEAGQLGVDDLWRRIWLALEANALRTVRRLAALHPALTRYPRTLDKVLRRPDDALSNRDVRASRELSMIAIAAQARRDPAAAAAQAARLAGLRDEDRAALYARIGAMAAIDHLPEALDWIRRAGGAQASDDTLEWHARAALRAGDWPLLRAVVGQMSEATRSDPTWVYWLARGYAQQGMQDRARALYARIADSHDFYGLLAAEELGRGPSVPARARPPSEAELAAAASDPGFRRALDFYRLGLRFEGNREWNFQLRGLSDRQLLAAAEFARRNQVFDRAVNTSERTTDEHDFDLRFLRPFGEAIEAAAHQRGLEPAWVYGMIRQESRFVADISSSAGARGLMQLMPATARWAARKMGLRDFSTAQLGDVHTNLDLGTWYLRRVYDQFDGSLLLAAAGYNAGPGRPRAWRRSLSHPIEGAVFAETIPFAETRGYVKSVLTNVAIYTVMIDGRWQPLKRLLGQVQPPAP